MKKLTLFIFLSCYLMHASAQLQDRDSLVTLLSNEMHDTLRVNIYQKLATLLKDYKVDSARAYATQGLALARSVGFKKGEVRLKSLLANISYTVGDYATSIELDYDLLAYAKDIGDVGLEHSSYINLTNSYRDQGEYREALNFLWKLMENDRIYNNCNECGVGNAAIGSNYYGLKMYDSALYFIDKALTFPKDFSFEWILLMRGRVLVKMGRYDEAFDFFHQSIAGFERRGSKSKDLSGVYSSIGELFITTNQTDSAIYYGNLALDLASEKKYNKELMESYLLLSKAYERTNESTALLFYKKVLNLKDSLFNIDKQKQISNTRINEILRQIEIASSETEYKNQLRLNALLGSTFTLIAIAIFLIINNRTKQRAKKKIEIAYERLRTTQSQLIQSEKMASLGELTAGIAHEIQNPLNFVNNFSEVNKELLHEMEQAIEKGDFEETKVLAKDITENQEKINHHGKRAEGIVKGMLQHSRTSSGQKELTDINALCDEYLRLSYHGYRAKDKSFNAIPITIGIETDFDSSLPKINVVAQDIGRVILNLINNAFYTVNDRANNQQPTTNNSYEPIVKVLTKNLGDKIEISVIDNGNGIPDSIKDKIFQPFFTTKPTGQGTGLGLSLAYDIVTKGHNGELKVETKERERTTFVVVLPGVA